MAVSVHVVPPLHNLAVLNSHDLVEAGEAYHNDGPFDVPDDYHRLNGVLRYHGGEERDFYTVTAMGFSGKWNATDQVPERAIWEGVIGRYGSLNPSDGGISSRVSLSINRFKRSDTDQVQASAYIFHYKLDLWSTFTYFLGPTTCFIPECHALFGRASNTASSEQT